MAAADANAPPSRSVMMSSEWNEEREREGERETHAHTLTPPSVPRSATLTANTFTPARPPARSSDLAVAANGAGRPSEPRRAASSEFSPSLPSFSFALSSSSSSLPSVLFVFHLFARCRCAVLSPAGQFVRSGANALTLFYFSPRLAAFVGAGGDGVAGKLNSFSGKICLERDCWGYKKLCCMQCTVFTIDYVTSVCHEKKKWVCRN